MKNFRTFDLAVEFYRLSKTVEVENFLKDQLTRAASSIALNLAEGRGRKTAKDQCRFFQIAFGSVRECQAALMLADLEHSCANRKLDILAAHVYKLIKSVGG